MARRRHTGGEGIKLSQYSVSGEPSTVKTPAEVAIANEKAFEANTKGLFDTSTKTGVNKSPSSISQNGKLLFLGKASAGNGRSRRRKSKAAKKRMTRRRGGTKDKSSSGFSNTSGSQPIHNEPRHLRPRGPVPPPPIKNLPSGMPGSHGK